MKVIFHRLLLFIFVFLSPNSFSEGMLQSVSGFFMDNGSLDLNRLMYATSVAGALVGSTAFAILHMRYTKQRKTDEANGTWDEKQQILIDESERYQKKINLIARIQADVQCYKIQRDAQPDYNFSFGNRYNEQVLGDEKLQEIIKNIDFLLDQNQSLDTVEEELQHMHDKYQALLKEKMREYKFSVNTPTLTFAVAGGALCGAMLGSLIPATPYLIEACIMVPLTILCLPGMLLCRGISY